MHKKRFRVCQALKFHECIRACVLELIGDLSRQGGQYNVTGEERASGPGSRSCLDQGRLVLDAEQGWQKQDPCRSLRTSPRQGFTGARPVQCTIWQIMHWLGWVDQTLKEYDNVVDEHKKFLTLIDDAAFSISKYSQLFSHSASASSVVNAADMPPNNGVVRKQ